MKLTRSAAILNFKGLGMLLQVKRKIRYDIENKEEGPDTFFLQLLYLAQIHPLAKILSWNLMIML